MTRVTVSQLSEQVQALTILVEGMATAQQPAPQSGGATRTRQNRRGLATPDKRKIYLDRKIEVADRLAKEKQVHYSVFEIESGKLLLFSEITEHRNNQKGHKATEKWGPRLYNSKSGMTATGTAYIS